jgi:hypothetical protein
LGDIAVNLQGTMSSLKPWSHEKFGGVTSELEKLKKRLEELNSLDANGNQEENWRIRKQMDELLYREEMMWFQRSQISWLREGYRNIKSFHQKAAVRARKNKITCLTWGDGQITWYERGMHSMAMNFFKDLYKADPDVNSQQVVQMFQLMITAEMNDDLCKDFSDKEIGDALFQMGPLKALGPDGFPARFFQRNWEVMKADVVMGVRAFFATSHMPQGVNYTTIVLILKKRFTLGAQRL